MRYGWISWLILAAFAVGCGGDDKKSEADVTDVAAVDAAADTVDVKEDETVGADGEGEISEEVTTSEYPDPTFVHKFSADPVTGATDKFPMDTPTQYRTTEILPSLDVRVLADVGGLLWVGTGNGLFTLEEDEDLFKEVPIGEGVSPEIIAIGDALDHIGRLAVITDGALIRVNPDSLEMDLIALNDEPRFTDVAVANDYLWLGTEADGLYVANLGEEPIEAIPVDEAEVFAVRDVLLDGGGNVWLATADGVRRLAGSDWTTYDVVGGFLADNDVRALAFDPETNAIFAGTAVGIARITGDTSTILTAGIDKLPYDVITSIAVSGNRLALGHDIGATAVEDALLGDQLFARFDHYISERWLPDNEVRAVAYDAAGRLWVGTAAGLSRIDWVDRSLDDVAQELEELVEKAFWRMDGFVSSDATADDGYNPTTWSVHDKDNDGLWTQMQIGAWCYAYAATGEEVYYERARKATDAMMLQVDIPAVDFEAAGLGRGFVTRSLVRDDEGDVFTSKATQDNWHLVSWTDGHDYYWKDDTSSDEIDGHFYGYPLFHDLCAKTDEEREEVASYAADIARYIIKYDYVLMDLDGEKTSHGHWSPALIGAAAEGIDICLGKAKELEDMGEKFAATTACYESWSGGGWVNATQILGVLLATYHMTGDTLFYDEYEKLVTEHHFGNLVVAHDETMTVTSPSIMNHSDHELAMLAYNTIIRYEPNDDRRQKWIDGLLFTYEHEKVERNPLWTAYVALLAGPEHAELESGLQSLRQMPPDRREMLIDNTHRMDSADWPNDRFDKPQFAEVFAYDEIRTVWWNGNLHIKVDGGSVTAYSGPLAYLLPYWAFRYAGVISD
jgi:hypothetical protein